MRAFTRAVVSGSLLFSASPIAAAEWPTGAEADVIEAILRHIFAGGQSGNVLRDDAFVRHDTGKPVAHAVCVVLKRTSNGKPKPAATAFLKRFEPISAITRGSECKHEWVFPVGQVYEKRTRKPAIEFSVGPVRWLGADDADVRAGSTSGGLSGGWCTWSLRRVDGRWTVLAKTNCLAA